MIRLSGFLLSSIFPCLILFNMKQSIGHAAFQQSYRSIARCKQNRYPKNDIVVFANTLSQQDQRSQQLTRSYQKSNIDPSTRFPHCNARATSDWKRLFIPNAFQSEFGVDEQIDWTSVDDVPQVAIKLLQKLSLDRGQMHAPQSIMNHRSSFDSKIKKRLETDVTNSLKGFTTFCHEHFPDWNNHKYKARIISSRGLHASAKCPMWHFDHVPIRWIQSLAGPGVMWVNHDAVQWHTFTTNTLEDKSHSHLVGDVTSDEDDDDSIGFIPNSDRIDNTKAIIYQAKEGEAVILRGSRWNEFTSSLLSCSENCCQDYPVVHKSPENNLFLPWEGRVLLTIDVEMQ